MVLRRAASAGNLEDLKLLMENAKGIDLNSQDTTPGKQYTALHWAAKRGHSEVHQFLIENGADPDIKDVSQKKSSDYLQSSNNEDNACSFDYSKIFK